MFFNRDYFQKNKKQQHNERRNILTTLASSSLTLLFSFLFLSESLAATPKLRSLEIAQQKEINTLIASRTAAEQLFNEGMQLFKQGTAESCREAIALWEQALPLWRAIADKEGEAVTLVAIGRVYDALGEKQKALSYYNQALPLTRAVRNKALEAITLNNIGLVYSDLGDKQKALSYYERALPLRRAVEDKAGEATTLSNIGLVYSDLGDKQKALSYYERALTLRRAVGDKAGEAIILNNIGAVYRDLGEKQKALSYYNQSLPLFRAVGNKPGEAVTLNNIGLVYDDLGEKQKALSYYNQALLLRRAVGDKAGEARTLSNIGSVYSALGEKQKALSYYNQALPLSRAVGDKAGEAITLNNIGSVYSDLGEKQKALSYYNQALPVIKAVGDRAAEASTLNKIGAVYSDLGEQQKALSYYNQALPLRRAVGDKAGEAITLNNIGGVYDALGEKQKALSYYNQSLSLTRAVENKAGEAIILNNIGAVYSALGEQQKALSYYNQALPLKRAVGDKTGEANTLSNIGFVYSDLGEQQKALSYYNQALPLTRAVGDKAGEASILNNIGGLYSDLGDKQKALSYYNQSLPLRRVVGDKAGEANTLSNIGKVYSDLGEQQKALSYYRQALPLTKAVGDKAAEAITISNIGAVYYDLGEKQKALSYYNQALPLTKAVGDKAAEALIFFNIANLERSRSNLKTALEQMDKSIKILEELRTKVVNPQLRTSYFASVQGYYQFYIDLLMELHQKAPSRRYDIKAYHASESSRARSLLELLTEANADIRTGVDANLLQQERSLQQQIAAREKLRVELISKNLNPERVKQLERERENLLSQLNQVQTQIRLVSPAYAALKMPQPLTLSQVQQQVLDDETVVLQYSLGEERSYLWLVTSKGMSSYQLPPAAEIEKKIIAFYLLLQDRSFRFPTRGGLEVTPSARSIEPARQLSQILLAPVAAKLNKKRILVVADGALQYIPFAALPLPQTNTLSALRSSNRQQDLVPLISKYEIVHAPSSSTIAIVRKFQKQQLPSRQIAIFADPVFSADDRRLTALLFRANARRLTSRRAERDNTSIARLALQRAARDLDVGVWQRLPGTRNEAEAILKLVSPQQEFHVFDFDANLNAATKTKLDRYRIVHFATHGLLDTKSPELSGLVLSLVDRQGHSIDGFLRLHQIFNLDLNADLVILSACQTGLGQNVRGEGIVGLTRGFMYAGTPRVVVSLWSVADEATAEFMSRFYTNFLKKGLTATEALRATQLEMQQETKWKSPYFWAAFTLQGEWR